VSNQTKSVTENYAKIEHGDKQMETAGQSCESMSEEIELEIVCPRCYGTMILSSDFDCLYYTCEECDFVLYTVKKPAA